MLIGIDGRFLAGKGYGTQSRDFVYIDDIVEAIVRCAERRSSNHKYWKRKGLLV